MQMKKVVQELYIVLVVGVTTDLSGMLKDILGSLYNEDEVEAKFNLLSMRVQNIVQNKPKSLFTLPKKVDIVNEDLLKKFRVYHPYLAQRGISENTAKLYDIGFDDINKHITFPIKNINNKCIGIGRRYILKKEYYYPPQMIKPLYGLYELEYPIRFLYVVEGPFNLWSLSEWGKKGVALLGTGTAYQYDQLSNVVCDGYVLALDPDDAGRNGTKKIIKYLLNKDKSRIYVLDLPDGRDVNDLSHQEFKNINVLTYKEWQYKYKYF